MTILYMIVGIVVLGIALAILFYVINFCLAMVEWVGGEFFIMIGAFIGFIIAAYYLGRWLIHILA